MNNILYKYVDVDTFLKMFIGEKALTEEILFSEINLTIRFNSITNFRYNDYEDGLGYINNEEYLDKLISLAKLFKEKISRLKLEGIEEFRIYNNDALATLNELNIIYYSCIENKRDIIDSKEKSINNDYQKLISIYSTFRFDELLDQYFEMSMKKANSFRSLFEQKYGIFCLTENENNLAMWSHYCKNGGFVIVFDINQDFFRKNTTLKEIEYSPIRPVVSDNDIDVLSKDHDMIHPVFYTKDISWTYEREVRAFIKRNSIDEQYYSIPTEFIKEVILGFAEYPLEYHQFIKKLNSSETDKNKDINESLRIKYKNITKIISILLQQEVEVTRLIPYGTNGYSKLRHHKNELSIEY